MTKPEVKKFPETHKWWHFFFTQDLGIETKTTTILCFPSETYTKITQTRYCSQCDCTEIKCLLDTKE